jgi:hypothetical protein
MSGMEDAAQFRQEAERLALLPRNEQKQIVSMIRRDARNPKVSKRDREYNGARARTLAKLLGLAGT